MVLPPCGFFQATTESHQLISNAQVQLLPPLPRKSNGRLRCCAAKLVRSPYELLLSDFASQITRLQPAVHPYSASVPVPAFTIRESALLKRSAPVRYRTSTFEWFASFVPFNRMRGAQYPSSLLTLWLVTPTGLAKYGLDCYHRQW